MATWIYSSTTVAEVPETTTMAPPRKRVTGDKNKSKLDELWAVLHDRAMMLRTSARWSDASEDFAKFNMFKALQVAFFIRVNR